MNGNTPRTALSFYLDELLKKPQYTLTSIAHAVGEPEDLISSLQSGHRLAHPELRRKLLGLYYHAYQAEGYCQQLIAHANARRHASALGAVEQP